MKVLKVIYNVLVTIISIPFYLLLTLSVICLSLIESIKAGETTIKTLLTEIRKNRKSYLEALRT
jgi:hypothetical protein